jgi:16S rRNA (guanine527-N7)-methyltransferase
MSALSTETIAGLLGPYLEDAASDAGPNPSPDQLWAQLSVYLELLLKWNARTNLTAIREPEEIVRRHFGESLFAGRQLGACKTLLDFGSGAGFPGVPIQLLRPEIKVTLAESQNKKATFLREVVRTLGLKTEVWAGRVEAMPPERRFEVVSMRAVDDIGVALREARGRVAAGGELMVLTTTGAVSDTGSSGTGRTFALPQSAFGVVYLETFHVERRDERSDEHSEGA